MNLTSAPWNDEPMDCPWCAYSTISGLPILLSHISAVHLSYFPFGCTTCGHWLSSEAMLKYHCELTAHTFKPTENRDPDKEQRLLEVMKVLTEKPTPKKLSKPTPKKLSKPTPKKQAKTPSKTPSKLLKPSLSKITKPTPKKPTPKKMTTKKKKAETEDEDGYDSDETGVSTATTKTGKWKFMSKERAKALAKKKAEKDDYDSDETGVSTVTTKTGKEKFRCNKCVRLYTMSGVIKHVWRHLADEGHHVFECTYDGCGYNTFRLPNALFHHRQTHKNDENARILDHRNETKQMFETRLTDCFNFDDETVQKLTAMQNN